ncbi:MAG: haloacid dehalogenase type II [Pseudomonadota bacterium]
MALKAAIFDVFGTVVDWRRGVAEAVVPMLTAKGISMDPLAFADAWRAEYQPGMEQVRSGARGYVPLDALHLENLDRVLTAHGLANHFDAAERAALNTAWEKLPPWPDCVGGIAAIGVTMPVAPCSNGSVGLIVRLARFAGLTWDAILGADVARAYKPDPEAYRRSVAALGLAPAEVVMVAAHNGDLAAARAEGLKTAFIPRPSEHGPGQTTDLAPSDDWDFVGHDMVDLAAKLA